MTEPAAVREYWARRRRPSVYYRELLDQVLAGIGAASECDAADPDGMGEER